MKKNHKKFIIIGGQKTGSVVHSVCFQSQPFLVTLIWKSTHNWHYSEFQLHYCDYAFIINQTGTFKVNKMGAWFTSKTAVLKGRCTLWNLAYWGMEKNCLKWEVNKKWGDWFKMGGLTLSAPIPIVSVCWPFCEIGAKRIKGFQSTFLVLFLCIFCN